MQRISSITFKNGLLRKAKTFNVLKEGESADQKDACSLNKFLEASNSAEYAERHPADHFPLRWAASIPNDAIRFWREEYGYRQVTFKMVVTKSPKPGERTVILATDTGNGTRGQHWGHHTMKQRAPLVPRGRQILARGRG